MFNPGGIRSDPPGFVDSAENKYAHSVFMWAGTVIIGQ